MKLQNIAQAKTQAKILRGALSKQAITISHSQALELIAQQQGERDWNTLYARLVNVEPMALKLNETLKGHYMGQTFTGKLVALAKFGIHYKIAIKFDKPIDTVIFDSFSNLRRNIKSTVTNEGVSLDKNAQGVPHLVLDLK